MMYLTTSQLATMDALFSGQVLPPTFPTAEEYSFMDLIAPDMTLESYLSMPDNQQRKWWISCDTQPPVSTGITDDDTGEDIYATHYYFEPASPEILNRVY